ncbi:PREDICTED: uncharacterized protein LOC100637709 [Amphimedon queenslandica]|nr:PREDICTED: uncharacterized protein LOC100637709 [Amphimedon queenslandica]|eukprot:XP_003386349.1 PREDICTED: uncharacterized protein LOC100637709 [Amphimedon queenslandica]
MAAFGKGILYLCVFFSFVLSSIEAKSPPVIADDGNRTYLVRDDNNEVCLYTSFQMVFYLSRSIINGTINGDEQAVSVPKADAPNLLVDGFCNDTDYSIVIDWTDSDSYPVAATFAATMNFKKYGEGNKYWSLTQVQLTVSTHNGTRYSSYSYSIRDESSKGLFNRTFSTDQYFYCKGCKKLNLNNDVVLGNSSATSYVTLEKTVIYLGSFENSEPEKHTCQEDWVAFRELIVPIVVGACLALLLIVVLLVYIIAFARRRILEKKGAEYRRLEQ